MFRIDEIETRAHRFVIGDALRIVALHDAHYGRRELNVVFLHHLEVAYDIDLGGRGNEGNAVEHILRENVSATLMIPFVPSSLESRLLPMVTCLSRRSMPRILTASNSTDEGIRSITVPLRSAATASSFFDDIAIGRL